MIDLGHLGVSAHPQAPQRPTAELRRFALDAHSLVKAHRVWLGTEKACRALGASSSDIERLRPLGLALGSVVYDWDAEVEQAQSADGGSASGPPRAQAALTEMIRLYGMPAAGLRYAGALAEYWQAESLMVTQGFSEDLFLRMAPLRSSDIKIQLLWILDLLGYSDSEGVIEAIQPGMEIREVCDDLESYAPDTAEGSFNSYHCAVQAMGERTAQRWFDDYAQARADLLCSQLVFLERGSQLAAFKVLLSAAGVSERRIAGALSRLPASWLAQRIRVLLSGAFAPYWKRRTLT